jgi:hypothetical protein
MLINAEPFPLELLLNGAKIRTLPAHGGGVIGRIEFDQIGLDMPIIGRQIFNQNPENSVDIPPAYRGTFTMPTGTRTIVLEYHAIEGEASWQSNTVQFT